MRQCAPVPLRAAPRLADLRLAALLLAALLLAGCSFSLPRVHKITIQQGNVISQEMIDQLKPGMTRSQVAFIMGEPVVQNSFDTDRWDYIYTIDVPGVYQDDTRVTLFFENDVLAYFTGDLVPSSQQTGQAGSDADAAATEMPASASRP